MNKLLKNVLILFGIGTIIFFVGNGIYEGFNFKTTNELLTSFGLYQLYSFVIGTLNMSYFGYLEKQTWKANESIKRIIIGIIGSVVLTLIALFFLNMFTNVIVFGQSYQTFMESQEIGQYKFGIWITLTMLVIFHFIYFYNKYQQNKVKESQIVAKNQTAKFESLKNQLDPHFLFNSLNVLTSLIGENPKQAEKFTTKLSKVYRYVLEQKDKDLIPLEEELKFAKSYMELLKMRFEGGVHFSIPETVSNPELKIVPLSLQLLLENAVKHNVITSNNPLEIRIYEQHGFLIVENNINLKASLGKSTKVGLKNINQRYGLISREKVEISSKNNIFKVKLPLLTQKIKTMRTDYINDSAKYIRAKKRVDDIKAFYGNLISYCVVIPFLIFINYRTSWDHKWFYYPMFGWGLGVVIQAFTVFGYGSNWEDRKIREIMEKDNNH
ncbi:MAG: 2TM domain-containing protein [Flavobacteriaceae bacterium]|nr:2TM domain-containing protein [Flavobacteriaceae bacterium]